MVYKLIFSLIVIQAVRQAEKRKKVREALDLDL